MAQLPRTWIEISASAVRHNLRSFQRLVGSQVGIMPIIKANAYGHGLREMVAILKGEKHAALGVAYGEEALRLRGLGFRGRVVVLSYWGDDELVELMKNKIELVVWDFQSLASVTATAKRLKLKPKVHIKLDTGTTRIGFLARDVEKLQRIIRQQNSFTVVGLFSHFANAEERSTGRTRQQLKSFTTLDEELALGQGIERHMACTAAILRYPEARFGLVRLGIGLYGLWPSDAIRTWARATVPAVELRPVLQWKARIEQIKKVPRGTGVGYGSTWIARRPSLIAVIPVGYGDGYYRSWSNRSWVMIRGRRAPVVGRISMNLFMIDGTNVPNLKLSDSVTLLGPGISGDTLARLGYQTLHYEVTTTIHPSIPRVIT